MNFGVLDGAALFVVCIGVLNEWDGLAWVTAGCDVRGVQEPDIEPCIVSLPARNENDPISVRPVSDLSVQLPLLALIMPLSVT